MAEDDGSKSLISADDLIGLGGVAKKAIGALEKAVGRTYRPRAIRKEAAAGADAMRLLAKGQADADKIIAEGDNEILERAQERLVHQEVRRQKNIDAVVGHMLEHATELDDEPKPDAIDEDWMIQFLNRAQDVGHDEMQKVWGRILAQEVADPGSFSIRSLETLSRMTRAEAEIFQKARYLSTDSGNILKLTSEEMEPFLSVSDILTLRSIGLMHDGDFLSVVFKGAENGQYGIGINSVGVIIRDKKNKGFELKQYLLTPVGKEVIQLIEPSPNAAYLSKLKKYLESEGYAANFSPPPRRR